MLLALKAFTDKTLQISEQTEGRMVKQKYESRLTLTFLVWVWILESLQQNPSTVFSKEMFIIAAFIYCLFLLKFWPGIRHTSSLPKQFLVRSAIPFLSLSLRNIFSFLVCFSVTFSSIFHFLGLWHYDLNSLQPYPLIFFLPHCIFVRLITEGHYILKLLKLRGRISPILPSYIFVHPHDFYY